MTAGFADLGWLTQQAATDLNRVEQVAPAGRQARIAIAGAYMVEATKRLRDELGALATTEALRRLILKIENGSLDEPTDEGPEPAPGLPDQIEETV